MSGIVGILNLDGEPVDRALLERMTEFMTFRGPDDQQVWLEGAVGFGHTMLRTTWEAEYEHQPFTLDSQVWIVADARIDDRENLASKLGIAPLPVPPFGQGIMVITDVEMILRAYLEWGDGCVEHLLGDFAFAIWDGHKKRLFCARDQLGIKPFYYSRTRNIFLFSSSIDCLRHHPKVFNELNDETIGDFLLFGHNQNEDTTIYANIFRIPPAHHAIVTDEMVQIERYWNFPTGGEIRYTNDTDYVEHYREIFTTAVKDRLRSDKISISLSGGMDSSSIAAMAVRQLAPTHGHSALRGFSYATGNLLPDNQEPFYTNIVSDSLKIPLDYFSIEPYQPYERCYSPELYSQQPIDDYKLAFSIDYYKETRKHSRILLTGHGGDPIFLGSNLYYLSLIKNFKISHFLRDVTKHIHYFSNIRGLGLRTGAKLFLGLPIGYQFEYPNWLQEDFANKFSLKDKFGDFNNISYTNSSPHPGAYECLSSPTWSDMFESECNPNIDIEIRHPLLDVRLIQFIFAINIGFWGTNKKIHRDSMKNFLPDIITSRPKTSLVGDLTLELFKLYQSRNKLYECLDIVTPYVNTEKYSSSLEEYISRGNSNYSNSTPLSLGVWLKNSSKPTDNF
jgi:asparagine synthase (glutamine-hydrolysing)